MLTTQQESYFETFGFLMMKQYFSAPEMEEISRQFDSVLNKGTAMVIHSKVKDSKQLPL